MEKSMSIYSFRPSCLKLNTGDILECMEAYRNRRKVTDLNSKSSISIKDDDHKENKDNENESKEVDDKATPNQKADKQRNIVRINSSISVKNECQNENRVDCIPMVLDDGPEPMRQLQKTERNPNAVDRLLAEHRDERIEEKKDRVGEVHQHNETYPKMKEALEKRRSLMKATEKRNNGRRRRNQSLKKYNNRTNSKRIKNNRIRKKKTPRKSVRKRVTRKQMRCVSLGCQCEVKLVDKNCSVAQFNQKHFGLDILLPSLQGYNKKSGKKGKKSDVSMSSYNSFLSMDHEPMV